MIKFFISPLLILGLTEHLFKAPSIQEINQIKRDYSEKRRQVHLCQKQLEKNKIPKSCYKISSLSKDFKKHLNKKCAETPLESLKLHEISDLLKNRKISPQCLKSLEEKEKILRYQQQDRPVGELLKHHLM